MSAAIPNISLYIPHVFSNISSKKICDIFDFQAIGDIQKVDLIPKKNRNGKRYNAAYIHFYEWYDNIASRNFQDQVLDKNKEARIVYDEPWYWIVLENKGRKFKPGDRKPVIDISAFDGSKNPVKSVNEKAVKNYDDNYKYYRYCEDFSRSRGLGEWLSEPSVELKNKTIENIVDDLYEEFSLSDRFGEEEDE